MCYNNRNPADIRNKPETGGGALYDVGSYAVTGCRMAFGAEPTRALGLFEHDPDFGTDRLASAILQFPDRAGDDPDLDAGRARDRRLAPASRTDRREGLGAHGLSLRAFGAVAVSPLRRRHEQHRLQAGARDRVRAGQSVQRCRPSASRGWCAARALPAFPIELAIANMRVLDALRRSGESRGVGRCLTRPTSRSARCGRTTRAQWRALRLEALRAYPTAFAMSYEEAAAAGPGGFRGAHPAARRPERAVRCVPRRRPVGKCRRPRVSAAQAAPQGASCGACMSIRRCAAAASAPRWCGAAIERMRGRMSRCCSSPCSSTTRRRGRFIAVSGSSPMGSSGARCATTARTTTTS